jgi:elongation of very long chain fatty acids protein 6
MWAPAFMTNFQWEQVGDPMRAHPEIPFIAAALYLGLVFCVPPLLKNRAPFNLRSCMIAWNLFLSAFSIVGTIYTVPALYRLVLTRGMHASICEDPRLTWMSGVAGCWSMIFGLSKIPEMIDTVFLVAQKKEVIFLHWYHHLTVMLYCWHGYVTRVPCGLWFAAMNFSIHSVMYLYYACMAVPSLRPIVKTIGPFITTLQIAQMASGLSIVGLATYLNNATNACEDPDRANLWAGTIMYFSYFLLFNQLRQKKAEGRRTEAPSSSSTSKIVGGQSKR